MTTGMKYTECEENLFFLDLHMYHIGHKLNPKKHRCLYAMSQRKVHTTAQAMQAQYNTTQAPIVI